jgi:hypothetical protein
VEDEVWALEFEGVVEEVLVDWDVEFNFLPESKGEIKDC